MTGQEINYHASKYAYGFTALIFVLATLYFLMVVRDFYDEKFVIISQDYRLLLPFGFNVLPYYIIFLMYAICLFGLIRFIRDFIIKKPILTVGSSGFFDRRNFKQPVPWSEVISVNFTDTSFGRIQIKIKEPQRYGKFHIRQRSRLYKDGGDLSISTYGLKGSHRDVVATIRRFYEASKTTVPQTITSDAVGKPA